MLGGKTSGPKSYGNPKESKKSTKLGYGAKGSVKRPTMSAVRPRKGRSA